MRRRVSAVPIPARLLLLPFLLPLAASGSSCIADAKVQLMKNAIFSSVNGYQEKPPYRYRITWRNICSFRLPTASFAVKFFSANGDRIGMDFYSELLAEPGERFDAVIVIPKELQFHPAGLASVQFARKKVTQ